VFNALRLTINACQRGVGNTKVSMYTNVIANIVNIVFNYLLITGNFGFPRLEIKGAAIATVFGNFVAFVISLISLIRSDEYLKFSFKKLFSKDREASKHIFNLFPSTMLEQAVMRVGFILFALIVNYLGTQATYVHGVCNDINVLAFTLADGFAIGTSAIVGHRLGENRKDLAIVYAKVSMILSVGFAIVLSVMMVILREPLILLYKPETTELLQQAKYILLIAAITTIPQNIQWVLTGILRGAGDTKFTATTSLISVTILRPAISYVLCYFTPLGIIGAWIGMFIDQVIRLILNISRFSSRVWMEVKL
jgi:putative MATE family efflux protein